MFTRPSLLQFSDFTWTSIVIFKTVGIEPYRTDEVHGYVYHFFQCLLFHLGTWNIVVSLLGEFVYLLKSFGNFASFLEITAVAPCIVFCLKVLGKILTILYNREKMTCCIQQLEIIFPKTTVEHREFKIDKYVKHMATVIRPYVVFCMSAIWVFNLYEACYSFYEYYFVTGVFVKDLPFLIWYPFDTANNWVYAAVYFHQCYAGYVAICVLLGTDFLLCTIMRQIIMHFDYISHQLVELKVTGTTDETIRLRSLIQQHITILRISDDVNKIFNVSIFLNFISSTFTICLAGFQVTAGASLGDLIKYFAFLTYELVNIFLVCYHGTIFVESSLNVSQAAYNQEWFAADNNYKKNLLFLLTRAQRPAVMNATSLSTVSLQSFNKIMSTSYQCFALLRSVYKQ